LRTWVHEHIRFRQGIKNVLGFLCDSHSKPLSLCLCLPARPSIPTPKRTNKVLGKVVHIEILNKALKVFSFEWLTCQAERSSWNFPSTLNHQMPSLLCWQFTLLMRVHMPNSLFQNHPCNPYWHFTSFLSSVFAHQTHSLIWVLEGRCSCWLRHSILHMESDACCLERRWVVFLKSLHSHDEVQSSWRSWKLCFQPT